MKSHSLKYLRLVAAALCLAVAIVLFADFSGTTARYLAAFAKMQFVPALLAVNFLVLIFLIALTLIFGRLYCSVLCPLGITQDLIAWFRRVLAKKTKRRIGLHRYQKPHKAWRYGFLALFAILFVGGLASLIPMSYAGLLDPYSMFGRITAQSIVPVWRTLADSAASSLADKGIYPFASIPSAASVLNYAVSAIAAISFIAIAVFAWRTGRGYCNTVCPVGTILGFLSRFSLLKPVIDTDKCNRCGSCGRKCKSSCIDTKNHVIDYSRCVVCMDCINNCSQGAISYRIARKAQKTEKGAGIDKGRRTFIIGTSIAAGTLASAAAGKVTDGGLAPLKQKQRRKDIIPAVPAGAISLQHFRNHCTACQLCVSQCPNEVLKPGISLDGIMQPVMTFTDGFCRPECTRCGQVCPTGAIRPVDQAEKAAIKTGSAKVDLSICISAAYGQKCGSCARHCPADAIRMVKGENGNLRPTVDESRCIGCGACEYHCPSGTVGQLRADHAAIYVDGLRTHQTV